MFRRGPGGGPARRRRRLSSLPAIDVAAATPVVFRPPLLTRIWRPDWTRALGAQLAVNLLVTTLAVSVAAPFAQTAWPNPVRSEPTRELRTFLGPVPRPLVGQDQFFGDAGQPPPNRDWPNARGPVAAIALRTWTLNLLESTLGLLPPAPFALLDWPNPPGRLAALDLRTWLLNLQQSTLLAAPPPFSQSDWPLPARAEWPRELRTFLSPVRLHLLGQDTFFGAPGQAPATTDWPVPRGPLSAIELRTWVLHLNQTTLAPALAAAPFFLTDWPNPRGPEWNRDLRTFLNPVELHLLGQDQFFGGPGQPPANRDWPTPRGPVGGIELRTWLVNLSQSTLAPAVTAFPFYQLDWPNPRGAMPAIGLKTWVEALKLELLGQDRFFGAAGQPPANRDWPVPNGAIRARDLLTWLINLQQSTLQLSPFSQTAWPVPRGSLHPIGLRTWLDPLKLPLLGKDALPFLQTNWPNPRGPVGVIVLRSWVDNPLNLRVLVPFGPARILIVPGIATAFLVPTMDVDFTALTDPRVFELPLLLVDFTVPSQPTDFILPEEDDTP